MCNSNHMKARNWENSYDEESQNTGSLLGKGGANMKWEEVQESLWVMKNFYILIWVVVMGIYKVQHIELYT